MSIFGCDREMYTGSIKFWMCPFSYMGSFYIGVDSIIIPFILIIIYMFYATFYILK